MVRIRTIINWKANNIQTEMDGGLGCMCELDRTVGWRLGLLVRFSSPSPFPLHPIFTDRPCGRAISSTARLLLPRVNSAILTEYGLSWNAVFLTDPSHSPGWAFLRDGPSVPEMERFFVVIQTALGPDWVSVLDRATCVEKNDWLILYQKLKCIRSL